MKLNDPFGRLTRREEQEYESLHKTLKETDVNTRRDAEVVLERIKTRRTNITFAVLSVLFLGVFFFPEAFILILIFGGMIILWVFKTTMNASKHVQRYIEEEISESDKQQ